MAYTSGVSGQLQNGDLSNNPAVAALSQLKADKEIGQMYNQPVTGVGIGVSSQAVEQQTVRIKKKL